MNLLRRILAWLRPWAAVCLCMSGAVPVRAEAMLQLFNLTWEEVTAKLPEIAEAGYTSLWLPPPTKAGSGFSIGYDVFDPFDLGDKDQRGTRATHYGTRAELLRMVRMAHRFGLRVYFDNIVNHRGFEVPGYNAQTPVDLYPGMVPGDFHLLTTPDGFYRNVDNIRDFHDVWQVLHLSLGGLVDIAHEDPNANFGPTEGSIAPKPRLVRHPNHPEYYDLHPTRGRVGFGNVTQADLQAQAQFYTEDVNAYLLRAVRWLIDQTHCDGLRLDAVKHVPDYFFGQQSGADKDTSSAGYVGQAQLQFNLTHGFEDTNHRDSNFDTERPRDDALIFGEHLGEPPAFGGYIDAGMRLLDNPLREHLNNVLGNPTASLAGLDQRDSGGFSAAVRVMHAQSHDNDFAARRELQNAFYFFREGVPLIYTDGYHQSPSNGGAPFPRHAHAPFLGQFADPRMPDLAWLHGQLARGGTRPRWSDTDIVAFERYDYREPGTAADQTVVLFVMNDNYGFPGDISFDDGVPEATDGLPPRCDPVQNSRDQGLVVGFPPGSHLRQVVTAPGVDRACSEVVVRLATNNRDEAWATRHDPNPINRKVYVAGQALAPGGGAIEFKVPSGSYVAYAYAWPEPSRVDATLPNASGQITDADVIALRQNGRLVPRMKIYRSDGPDGDPNFNPIYPFARRGSLDLNGEVMTGRWISNRTYAIDIPVVTNAGPLDFLVRVDGSASAAWLKLDGGVDLNSHLGLGPRSTRTHGLLDLRDHKPGQATDVFLGYEEMRFARRLGPEKFAARDTARNSVVAAQAETYAYTVGSDATTMVLPGTGLGHAYTDETCAWVYHDPADQATVAGQAPVRQRSSTVMPAPVELWVKVGYQFQINTCWVYYTTNRTPPDGAHGVGRGDTHVVQATFAGDDAQDPSIDWWRAVLPAQPSGTQVRYKIGLAKSQAGPIVDYAPARHYALTEFAIPQWRADRALIWLHNDLATNQTQVGLSEGFHILRARVFLPRAGKSSMFNTFIQTFYYDTRPPDGAVVFPSQNGERLTSASYEVVVRADETATGVEFNIADTDPNNDDTVTGRPNGNGNMNGQPVWVPARQVPPLAALDAQYPQLPREFRFSYAAVPSGGTATIRVRVNETSSLDYPEHHTLLVRTVEAAGPPAQVTLTTPAAEGQILRAFAGQSFTFKACLSAALAPDPNALTALIDGLPQPRTDAEDHSLFSFGTGACGSGAQEVRYAWPTPSAGAHVVEIVYNDGARRVSARRSFLIALVEDNDSDADGLPDVWESEHGLDPARAAGPDGPTGDPDADSFTNLEEYLAGTDPQDNQSLLRVSLASDARVLVWRAVPGRMYQVYSASNRLDAFTPTTSPMTATSFEMRYTNPPPSRAVQFYRIKVLP